MPFTSTKVVANPRRRALSEARNLESRFTHLEQQDRELLICDWVLERHQLQSENKKLARQLEDANSKISSLRKKLRQTSQHSNESVSSHDTTVKAGSTRLTRTKSQKQKMVSKLRVCCKAVQEKSMLKDKMTRKQSGVESTSKLEGENKAITWETPRPESSLKASRYPRVQLSSSFDSTEASSRASLAEF